MHLRMLVYCDADRTDIAIETDARPEKLLKVLKETSPDVDVHLCPITDVSIDLANATPSISMRDLQEQMRGLKRAYPKTLQSRFMMVAAIFHLYFEYCQKLEYTESEIRDCMSWSGVSMPKDKELEDFLLDMCDMEPACLKRGRYAWIIIESGLEAFKKRLHKEALALDKKSEKTDPGIRLMIEDEYEDEILDLE